MTLEELAAENWRADPPYDADFTRDSKPWRARIATPELLAIALKHPDEAADVLAFIEGKPSRPPEFAVGQRWKMRHEEECSVVAWAGQRFVVFRCGDSEFSRPKDCDRTNYEYLGMEGD